MPRADNLGYIQQALEQGGIEFSENNGVRTRTEKLEIVKLEGGRHIEDYVLDILRETRNGEVLYNISSEENFEPISAEITNEYYKHLTQHNVGERLLIGRAETYVIAHPAAYRWIRRDLFNHVGYVLYGDNVAFLIPNKPHRIVIIRNPGIADMFRRQFEANWMAAEIPWFAKDYKDEDPEAPWSSIKGIEARAWIEKMKAKHKTPS